MDRHAVGSTTSAYAAYICVAQVCATICLETPSIVRKSAGNGHHFGDAPHGDEIDSYSRILTATDVFLTLKLYENRIDRGVDSTERALGLWRTPLREMPGLGAFPNRV